MKPDPDNTIMQPLSAPPLTSVSRAFNRMWYGPVFQRRLKEALVSRRRATHANDPAVFAAWFKRWLIFCGITGGTLGLILLVILKTVELATRIPKGYIVIWWVLGFLWIVEVVVLIIFMPRSKNRLPTAVRLRDMLHSDKADHVMSTPLTDAQILFGEFFAGLSADIFSVAGGFPLFAGFLAVMGLSVLVPGIWIGTDVSFGMAVRILALYILAVTGVLMLRMLIAAIIDFSGMSMPYIAARAVGTIAGLILVMISIQVLFTGVVFFGPGGPEVWDSIGWLVLICLIGDLVIGSILYVTLSWGMSKFRSLRRRR